MGNVQSGSALTRTTVALDSFVAELGGDIIFEKNLGSARFLKTVKCRHRNGYLVVKIFVKPDPGVSLRMHQRRLKLDREALLDIPNVYNYQTFVETEKAGYIIRQWVASSLYDRISTRPFLTVVEKKWISFQLLNALRDARNRKISHGDIKSENILVTSWNWIYLTDFASYKPTYLPLDDPADFSFFFDMSGRRTCYLAPERFYTHESNPEISAKKSKIATDDLGWKRDGVVTEAMDCFSAGCVIAELFLEGAPLFTLSQLFKYREGEFKVDGHLAAIEDDGVEALIKQMINLDPNGRPTFDTLLHTSRGTVFPECFYSFLHNYVSSINELSNESLAINNPQLISNAGQPSHPPSVASTVRPNTSSPLNTVNEVKADLLPSDSDYRLERIWADYESIEPYIGPESTASPEIPVKVEYTPTVSSASKPFQDILPVELHIPNRDYSIYASIPGRRLAATEDGSALVILALVTANIRNCSLPSSKVRALDVFLALACHLTDEAKLDRMVPYIVELLHDEAALVRSAALRTLLQVLMLVTVITPSNVSIFPEYIIPHIKHLVQDPEVSVRCTYAQCIVRLADTAVNYLEMGQALKAHGAFQLTAEAHEYESANFEISYDASMQELQGHIQEHLSALLMDPSSIVKRAVLHDISSLCIFLGRQKTNDVLLSHMITYLNDRDWLLRYAFFESVVDVAACAGTRSLEEYILPLMVQALSDVEESVVAKVLSALTSLCELELFTKMRICELMSATLGFLYHPNIWIRQGAVAFITAAGRQLHQSDIWCILYPSLRHFLKSDVVQIDEQSLLCAMKPPLPRQVLDAAVQWAMKGDKSVFWKPPKRSSKVDSPRDSVVSVRKTGNSSIIRNKSEEDEGHLTKLQQLGMTPSDESKLLALRDYTLKLANATSSFTSRLNSEPDTGMSLKVIGNIELQKLGVVPQTVFLKAQQSDSGTNTRSRFPILSIRRSNGSTASRTPILSPSRVHRGPSTDHNSTGAPFEDLRRRLATINASGSSLSVTNMPRGALSPIGNASTTSLSVSSPMNPHHPNSLSDRPPSPTESIVSTTNSVSFRPASRLQVGSTDGQKAAPAIGSSKANATGLLEAHFKIRSENSPNESGLTSPMSMSTTLRGTRAPRAPSLLAISTYDGQEQGISNLLENLYLDNNRELQHDFGPNVHDGPLRRRNINRQNFSSRDSANKRVEANLIANITSHSDAITGFAVSPDHMFFVSSSDDKTVKVWDTARLERNVTSKPRHTYGQHHARVKSVCILDGVHCFASAADDGSLHIVRVHITQNGPLPKYNKLQVIREHRVDNIGEYITCMTHYNTDTSSNLIYATTHSVITVMDLRTMRVLQTMENPRHYGPITSLCLDRKKAWIVVGTSTGVLTLWDKRFGLLIRSWHAGVASGGKATRIHQCVVHPSKGHGKWIMVALETSKKNADRSSNHLVEVWDIENIVLVETYVTRTGSTTDPVPEPAKVEGSDAQTTPAEAIAALVRSRQNNCNMDGGIRRDEVPRPPAPDVRAMIVGGDFSGYSMPRSEFGDPDSSRVTGRGFMITGSDDRKLRLWDLGKLDRTTVLSGIELEQERPVYSTSSTNGNPTTFVEMWPRLTAGTSANRPPQRISLITHSQQNLLKGHQDVITALACIDSPFRGGIISGDRSGVIKVWRVEHVDQVI